MDHTIGRVLDIVLTTGGAQVTILVPVALQISVDGGGQSVASNVEFPILV